jgi:hypothetical protein
MKNLTIKRLPDEELEDIIVTWWNVEGKTIPGTENHPDILPIKVGETAKVSIVPGTEHMCNRGNWIISNKTGWHHFFCNDFWKIVKTKDIEPKENFSFSLKIEVME